MPRYWQWSPNLTGSIFLHTPLLDIVIDETSGGRWSWRIYDGGRSVVTQSKRPCRTAEAAKQESLERLREGFARQVGRATKLLAEMDRTGRSEKSTGGA